MKRRIFLLLATMTLWACSSSGQPQTPTTVAQPIQPLPMPRADEVATKIVRAKITSLAQIDRLRAHPMGPKLVALGGWGNMLKAAGIDPLKDVDRAFFAARSASNRDAIIAVIEHHVAADKLKPALDDLVKRKGADGGWQQGYPYPVAHVSLRGRKGAILVVNQGRLVITSPAFASKAGELATARPLPAPPGKAAVLMRTDAPATTLKSRRAPRIPKTIRHAEGRLTLNQRDGSADLDIDGQSSNARQARADARELTKRIDKASSIKVAMFRVKAFRPIKFRADKSMVVARHHLSRDELDRLLGMAALATGR